MKLAKGQEIKLVLRVLAKTIRKSWLERRGHPVLKCANANRLGGEHILLFIVPRQIVELGDPARRSCDACESLGARMKKIIKHLTARNHLRPGQNAAQRRATSTRTGITSTWQRVFTVGYIEQAFTRLAVEEWSRYGMARTTSATSSARTRGCASRA